jgi:hypothetical protein
MGLHRKGIITCSTSFYAFLVLGWGVLVLRLKIFPSVSELLSFLQRAVTEQSFFQKYTSLQETFTEISNGYKFGITNNFPQKHIYHLETRCFNGGLQDVKCS